VVARITLPEKITLIKNWKLNSVHAFIEPIRFEEALTNLINNAVEAMPEGGILHVSAKVFPHHTSPKGPLSVLVEIEDSGVGIPAKYMDEIWKPFFTTNQSGTGIGLPESRKIITSMGGEISVQSEEGVGTVVSVWLKGEGDDGH
jgi:signal transduction histidine kinase